MTRDDVLRIFNIQDVLDLPRAAMELVLSPIESRNAVYRELLEANNFDLSHDWFQTVFEAEMSEGKRKGQHFTPVEIFALLPELVNTTGTIHEPTAGNGGLIIGKWWHDLQKSFPWEYRPSKHRIVAIELSDRSIPLLLLNLSIRGMTGYVYHGNCLENKYKTRYVLLNRTDDALGFSDVIQDDKFNKKIVEYEA